MDRPVSGSWILCDGRDQFALGCVNVHRRIHEVHTAMSLDIILREAPLILPHDTVDGLMLNLGINTHAASYAKASNIKTESVAISRWRGSFLGLKIPKGMDKKRMAVERCRHYGLDPVTHDEAESLGILTHWMIKNKMVPPWVEANPLVPPLF